MNPVLQKYYEALKAGGLTEEQDEIIRRELNDARIHEMPVVAPPPDTEEGVTPEPQGIYEYADLTFLQRMSEPYISYTTCLRSLDDLLERDKLREKDGFPRKIRVGRLIKPGRGGKDKFVVVPSTVEEKLIHDVVRPPDEEGEAGGTGEGEEGEVIGEQPVRSPEGAGSGPGEGQGGPHEMESSAYDLGKILTEKFELPNLKDKGKKRSLTRYTYDMTDRNRGFGQFLDKKATLRQIVKTNISLGHLPDVGNIDPTGFLISPSDRVYRILSREKDYESQAMVFFLRDYSGSMTGKPTELVVSQHVLIYSWLLYQYEKQVESRFILHDTEAVEVEDFYTYYNTRVAGGTKVASAFRLVNEIVEKENLVQDYNIYVFHGTDGDDWDADGKETLPEMKKMLAYANRIGITVARHGMSQGSSEVERYLNNSNLLKDKSKLIRMDVINQNADETRLIEGIKALISE
ncbi:hypothetical protein DENIS_1260 [Desulfonema ishimotonii]|uniref:DUF444 domain-containing protein n=1 Tax=Desulfonema ishimotonii TaxID=45657 RepID=A0A401FTL5_9BACT|nr:DUF444 family protein [Desulfonema ishimotonii]GBC60309.1 hypothetical protein DENIS_1260 [Desulfonema ishimotonii]